MYSTYEHPTMGEVECEARPTDAKKVVILGGGPNRIGQGIEFDYCCCHACFALTDAGYETIMVNCNPETVSTDYDTSDRLYFEPLTFEHVMEILRVEQENGTLHGVIVQFGGQTPLKLANALHDAGIPILGTTPDAIDLAEDRERFQQLVQRLGLKQPNNAIATTDAQAKAAAETLGYPLVIRPSYVLGGRAMEIVRDMAQLDRYIRDAVVVSGDSPVLLDSYLDGAVEVDVDALCDGEAVHVAGIMQHIEEAGVHSGDSACSLPPHTLPTDDPGRDHPPDRGAGAALNVVGLMNVQFAVKDGEDEIYLIEVNPRASRTVPFVAKATDSAIASIAARLMAGRETLRLPRAPSPHAPWTTTRPIIPGDPMTLADFRQPWFSVKEAVLPFARFPGVDTLLGPEMRSTGEVMGWDRTFPRAFLKAQLGAGTTCRRRGRSSSRSRTPTRARSGGDGADAHRSRPDASGHARHGRLPRRARDRVGHGEQGLRGRPDRRRHHQGRRRATGPEHDRGRAGGGGLRSMRAVTLADKIPYYTTLAASHAAAQAMKAAREGELGVRSLQGCRTRRTKRNTGHPLWLSPTFGVFSVQSGFLPDSELGQPAGGRQYHCAGIHRPRARHPLRRILRRCP
jgi:carbamoyl-phosphate synthase large subunit